MKKAGGYSGPFQQPSSNAAPGVWDSPSEAYAYILRNEWPKGLSLGAAPGPEVGDIIDVASYGVIEALNQSTNPVISGSVIIASGEVLSRTEYPDLFEVVSGTFGQGDGSTTFETIDIPSHFSYIKGTTNSNASYPGDYRASGVIPDHSHVLNINTSFSNQTGANGGGYVTIATSYVYKTDKNENSMETNEAKHQQVIHCLVRKNLPEPPVGSYVQVLVPGGDLGAINTAGIIPGGLLVPSGQEVSRSFYSTLFDRIGVVYGSGDGSTTFNIPDVAGLFTRGTADSDYVTLSGSNVTSSGYLRDAVGVHIHTYEPAYYHTGSAGGFGPATRSDPSSTLSSVSSIGGIETRPQNITAVYYLVAEGTV